MNPALAPPAEELLNPDTIVDVSSHVALSGVTPQGLDRLELRPESAPEGDRLAADTRPAHPPSARRQEADARAPVVRAVVQAPVQFKIRLASNNGERNSASYLIKKMYAWRGYQASAPQAAPNRITLVASDAAQALATITIGFDSAEGLMVEQLYPEAVGQLRAQGSILCEFTKLAVDREQQSRELLAMMFHVAYMYARRIQGCTDLLIEVNPRHARFYQRMLGFERLGEERLCPRVNAPAVLLWLKLAHAESEIARFGGRLDLAGSVRSLYPYFFSAEEENGIVGRLRAIG